MQNTLTTPLPLAQQPLVAPDFSATSLPSLPSRPYIARASEAPVMELPGEKGSMLMPSSKTGGQVTVALAEVDANGGPPPHIHTREDEIFIVRSGEVEFFCNGQLTQGQVGDMVYLSRDEAHRFRGLEGKDKSSFYNLILPGGFEEFFARWAPLFDNGAPEPSVAVALCGEYGINLFPSDELAPVVPNQKSKLVRASEAPVMEVLGTKVSLLLRADDTQGRYSLVRVEAPRDAGPPPHIHDREDEIFIIEEGEVEITLDNEKTIVRAGDVVWAPRGYVHTFRIASENAKFLAFMTPGGFEGFFVNCHAMQAAGTLNPASADALGEQFGLTNVPPIL